MSVSIAKDTWVIIPAFNEQQYLERVIRKVFNHTTNIVVVDDGSSDNTFQIAQKFPVHVLRHQVNLGKGAALKTGCEYAFQQLNAQAVIFIDSDDQHDPAEIPLFLACLESEHQIILGVRKPNGKMPWIRRTGSLFLSAIVNMLFGVYIPDILSGYKAFTKKAYSRLEWYSRNYGIELELAIRIARAKMPFNIISIKTIYHDYDRGMTIIDFFEMVIQLLTWRLFL